MIRFDSSTFGPLLMTSMNPSAVVTGGFPCAPGQAENTEFLSIFWSSLRIERMMLPVLLTAAACPLSQALLLPDASHWRTPGGITLWVVYRSVYALKPARFFGVSMVGWLSLSKRRPPWAIIEQRRLPAKSEAVSWPAKPET